MSDQERLLLAAARFRVVEIEQHLEDGSTHTRQVVRHPGAVVILPLVDGEHVCLIRSFRPAVNDTLLELPAGTLEPPDSPLETAHRELREETGYVAREMKPLHTFFLSPGILDERMHAFVASDLTLHDPEREPGELIENKVVAWSEAMRMLRDGEIRDAKTITTLLLYDQQRR